MSDNQDLVNNIKDGNNFNQENKAEVYQADNGMKINIMDQEGANLATEALRGQGSITRGPNTVPQQPPHGEDNPKYKSMGGDRPSLPTAPGESFNDKDYRNPDNRNNSNLGPTEVSSTMSASLGNMDVRSKELREEDSHKTERDNYNNKYNPGMTNTSKFGGSDALARQDELKKELTKETPTKPFFDLEFGSDEDDGKKPRDLHQEALDSNAKANEGFDPKSKLSNTGRSFFENEDVHGENAKLREDIEDLRMQIAELTKKFDDPNALQDALDPNRPRPLNPLEEVQTTLLKEEDERQRKFAQDVENERKLHDPLYQAVPVTPEVPPVTPEVPPTTPEQDKKLRDFKTAALIAGVVAGGAAGILGGAAVGGAVAATAGVISIGGRITNHFLGRSLTRIEAQIKNPETDSETKANLERRKTNLQKIQNVVQHITKFATGAALGAGISTFISNVAMGGHGLVWNRPEVPGGLPGVNPEAGIGKAGLEKPVGGGETPLPASPETYPGNSFIHDGRVDLPGSAWDGNWANGPAQDTLAGGAGNFANYAGGPSEMAASQLGQDLASNNITDQLLTNLTTYDKHRLLTQYWDAIRAGNANPELIETLKNMNTEGAQKLLAAIGK